jgi:hypothetical protein
MADLTREAGLLGGSVSAQVVGGGGMRCLKLATDGGASLDEGCEVARLRGCEVASIEVQFFALSASWSLAFSCASGKPVACLTRQNLRLWEDNWVSQAGSELCLPVCLPALWSSNS